MSTSALEQAQLDLIAAEEAFNAFYVTEARGAALPMSVTTPYTSALEAFGVAYRARTNVLAVLPPPQYHIQHVLTLQPPFPTVPPFVQQSVLPASIIS